MPAMPHNRFPLAATTLALAGNLAVAGPAHFAAHDTRPAAIGAPALTPVSMTRGVASPADQRVIRALAERGLTVTASQLESWRRTGLVSAYA